MSKKVLRLASLNFRPSFAVQQSADLGAQKRRKILKVRIAAEHLDFYPLETVFSDQKSLNFSFSVVPSVISSEHRFLQKNNIFEFTSFL